MSAISVAGWGRYRDAGVATFAVGPLSRPAVYLDRAEAGAAAADLGGSYIEWSGCTGYQVLTAGAAAYAGAFAGQAEPEPELEAAL